MVSTRDHIAHAHLANRVLCWAVREALVLEQIVPLRLRGHCGTKGIYLATGFADRFDSQSLFPLWSFSRSSSTPSSSHRGLFLSILQAKGFDGDHSSEGPLELGPVRDAAAARRVEGPAAVEEEDEEEEEEEAAEAERPATGENDDERRGLAEGTAVDGRRAPDVDEAAERAAGRVEAPATARIGDEGGESSCRGCAMVILMVLRNSLLLTTGSPMTLLWTKDDLEAGRRCDDTGEWSAKSVSRRRAASRSPSQP